MRRYDHGPVSFPTGRDHWSDWLILVPLIAARYVGMPIGCAVIVWALIT